MSKELTAKYGKGYTKTNLYSFYSFYKYIPEIFHSPSGKFEKLLSWTHYRILLQVKDDVARAWYEKEAYEQTWSVRTLQRNINTQYYYRILQSQNKELVEQEMLEKTVEYQNDKLEFIKNPVIAEFLGLSPNTSFTETELESCIISNIQNFLMELGKGYAFVARQQHIKTEKEDYFIDLVFYNYLMKCFVLVDLKTGKITHQDVGQMDMYVRMYDEIKKADDDNPTLGVVMCTETDEDIARYSVLHGNEQLFATKYKLYLPSEQELREEIETQKAMFYLQQREKKLTNKQLKNNEYRGREMNLPLFLKKVDANVSELTREELESFIHELARNLPENRRNYFLETMLSMKNDASVISSPEKDECGYSELYLKIEELKEVLTQINSGDRCLDSEYNEEWDDWYNSDVDEILFSDPEHILSDIEDGIKLVHTCIDMEAYKEGLALAELLSVLEVSVTGDYMDYDGSPLGVGELYNHALLNGSFEDVVRESLFLAYMGNELSVQAEELYCMMGNYQCFDVKLENVMQTGNHDLPGFKDFLSLWIDYLGNQTGWGVKKLLQEAQSMQEDKWQLLDTARKFVGKHPELYKQILQKGIDGVENDKMFRIGMEAMEKIPVSYVIRSEISLLTAEYAYNMNEEAAVEYCWLEAFRSETSVLNYIRIRYGARDWRKYEKQIRQICNDVYEQTKKGNKESLRYYDANAQRENTLHPNKYYALLFFEGEFEDVIKNGMHEKKALGWSSTFMKEGMAMFLLLMYEGEELPKGLDAMLTLAISGCEFNAEELVKGMHISGERNSRELFWNWFCKWKSEMDVSMEDSAKWIKKMEQLISMRTAGIMEANHRNYYGECAAFIAACGEVLESKGIPNAKAHIMEKYKSEYSRRRAFHQELRTFGMKK